MSHTPCTGSAIRLRTQVQPTDIEAVCRIAASTGFFSDEEIEIAVELLEDRLESGPQSEYQFILADFNGQPVGFATFGRIGCTVASYDLYWIAVHDAHRGSGIGRRLMMEVERLIGAAGGKRIYVETSSRDQYKPTRTFYERGGYTIDAVQNDFYAPGDGKVTFVKVLD
jgi:GNAT superfamily N-acetyltransferase